jgi:signal transduction histidine kinase
MNTHGVGLGLNICKQLVETFGGKIWVKSELNEGTQFYFTIPLSFDDNDSKLSDGSDQEVT